MAHHVLLTHLLLVILLNIVFTLGMDNSTNPVDYVLPEIAADSVNVSGNYNNFTVSWSLKSAESLPSVEVLYNISITEFTSMAEVYVSNAHVGTRTPYITGVDPQTRLRMIIQPYTAWRSGASQKLLLETPATVPGPVEDIRMLVRSSPSEHELIIRWDPPSFTGGIIRLYNISVTSQDGKEIFHINFQQAYTVPVEGNSLYDVKVCASTDAGYGNWSDPVTFNTSTASPLPVIYTLLYTPKVIEVKWNLSPLITDSYYTYKLRYYSDHTDWTSEYVSASNRLFRMTQLKSNTTYIARMHVCSKSENVSLWFAGVKCEFTNRASSTTFLQPQPLTLLAVGANYITLSWKSPAVQQVNSYAIRYRAVGERSYTSTAATRTTAHSNYTIMLPGLASDTSYEIVLVLEYPLHSDYTLPSSADSPFIVTTNHSVPGAVSIRSVECSVEKCEIATSNADSSYTVKVNISCPGDFEPLIYDVDNDGTKEVSRSLLPEDISECSVAAWSVNDIGSGPTSSPLLLMKKKEEGDNSNSSLAIALPLAIVLVLIVGVVSCLLYTRWRKRHQKLPKAHFDVSSGVVSLPSTESPHLHNPSTLFTMTENSLYEGQGVLQFRESISEGALLQSYEREKLTLTKFLGRGAFGEVYAGKAQDIVSPGITNLVAVKTLKSGTSEAYKEEFIKEARLMSQFDNEYIVKLLGVCIDREPYYIIIELMNEGDLVAFLRKSRPSRDRAGSLSLAQLVSVCIDVAAGCKYLEMLHFVHRDLAARNCLVNLPTEESCHRVKLGDFGLARDIYRNDYYRKEGEALLPVRWMSPEALVDGVFTTQSDIWAFGVLMWEVFSLAVQPYPARSNIEVLKFVTNSGTLDRPHRCPQILFEMMIQCWNYQSVQRPSFKDIYRRLCDFKTNNMTEEALSLFEAANQRLASENEFFAGSASSGAGVTQVVIESPVFEPDEHHLTVDLKQENEGEGNGSRSQGQFTNSSDPLSTSFKAFKNLFKRKRPGHMLERVHSMPTGSDRQTNRYVRSDSTISADGGRSIQTYTQQDGRQVSFDDSVLTNQGDNVMKAIAEELKGSSLCVDVSTSSLSPSLANVQYSTMAFGDSSGVGEVRADNPSSSQSVQYSMMSFDGKETSDSRVQYATMAFGESELSSSDSIDTAGRRLTPPDLPDSENISVDEGLSAPVADVTSKHTSSGSISTTNNPIQYSTMLMENSNDLDTNQQSLACSTNVIEQTTPTIQSTLYGAKVNYSSMQFSSKRSPIVRKKRSLDPSKVLITANEGMKTL